MANPALFVPLTQLNPKVQPATAAVIHKALALSIDERFASAHEMKMALETTVSPIKTWRRLWFVVGLCLLLLVSGLLGWQGFLSEMWLPTPTPTILIHIPPTSLPTTMQVVPTETAAPTAIAAVLTNTLVPIATLTQNPTNTPQPTSTFTPLPTATVQQPTTLFASTETYHLILVTKMLVVMRMRHGKHYMVNALRLHSRSQGA